MLADGLYDLPPGKLASVVTHLEMRTPPAPSARPAPEGVTLRRVDPVDIGWYRDLFCRVGGDWLWFSRLVIAEDELAAILAHPDVEVHALDRDGRAEGLVELDFRHPGSCELAFFGLTAALIGSGAGRYLMGAATERAWARPIRLFHVHTCTLDSPGALDFYRRSGFVPVRRQVEVADDPRLTGKLPQTAAPQVPLLRMIPLRRRRNPATGPAGKTA